jgi:hypothetical protein
VPVVLHFLSYWSVLQLLTLPCCCRGYRSGCFAATASPPADAWLLVGLLADTLPLFDSLADALSPLSLASSLANALLPRVT